MNREPIVPKGNTTQSFDFVHTDGKRYFATISTSSNKGDFLKILKISDGVIPLISKEYRSGQFFDELIDGQDFKNNYDSQLRLLKQKTDSQKVTRDAAQAAAVESDMAGTWNNITPYQAGQPVVGVASTGTSPVGTGVTININYDPVGFSTADAEGFVASIQPNNKGYISLQYPSDALYSTKDGGQDYLRISQYTYVPPQRDYFQGIQSQPLGDIFKGGLQRNTNIEKFLGVVKLPVPNELGMSNSVKWGATAANPINAAAFYAAMNTVQQGLGGNLGDAFASFGNDLASLTQSLGAGNLGAGTDAGIVLSSFIAKEILSKVNINVDPAQFITRGTGNTINPNLELLFSSPELRSFKFNYMFAPNDDKEASDVRKILRFFKQGMAPKSDQSRRLFLGSPNVFKLGYETGENEIIRGLPRYKICALTACTVDYAPGQAYQSYEDPFAGSQPVRMAMELNFTELTPIFESDYRNTAEDSVIDALPNVSTGNKINEYDVGF